MNNKNPYDKDYKQEDQETLATCIAGVFCAFVLIGAIIWLCLVLL
jgi:hypothetical protein